MKTGYRRNHVRPDTCRSRLTYTRRTEDRGPFSCSLPGRTIHERRNGCAAGKRNAKSSASRLHLTPSLQTKLLTTTPSRHAAHSVPLSRDSAYPLELIRKYSCDSLTQRLYRLIPHTLRDILCYSTHILSSQFLSKISLSFWL